LRFSSCAGSIGCDNINVPFDQQWSLAAMPRDLAILECTECKRRNYTTTRNKRTMSSRLEIKKYCPNERKRTVHKETK
jgi:large subunit ribosomal protein L33